MPRPAFFNFFFCKHLNRIVWDRRQQIIFIFSPLAGGWIPTHIKPVAYDTLGWLKCECLNIKVLKCFIKVPLPMLRICQLWSAPYIAHLYYTERHRGPVYICFFIHFSVFQWVCLGTNSALCYINSSQVQSRFSLSLLSHDHIKYGLSFLKMPTGSCWGGRDGEDSHIKPVLHFNSNIHFNVLCKLCCCYAGNILKEITPRKKMCRTLI